MKRSVFAKAAGLALMALGLAACNLLGPDGSPLGPDGFSAFQRAVLDELNLARTQPAEYARLRLAGGGDNGAAAELSAAAPVGALSLDAALCRAAQSYARLLADTNQFSHTADGDPGERITRAGYDWASYGENLAAGTQYLVEDQASATAAAEGFVKMLIIDAGVSSLGHRRNILDAGFTQVGVGYAHSASADYGNYHVQDFARPR